jgi:aerobic-type carbon monoxide dehydrogenase small subunit (CoxS/CutS family)
MQPNLCRCGTHIRILAAIHRAAAVMKQAALPSLVQEAAR